LWLTMTSTPQTSAINISQLLTFDRINFNPFDGRAPRVRNVLGWTVQFAKPTSSTIGGGSNNVHTAFTDTPSQLSIAAAWQFNRNIALKVVGTSQPGQSGKRHHQHACTFALLLKRWKQPRIMCTILGRHDFQTRSSSFLGVGLELETDASTLFGVGDNVYAAPDAHLSDKDTPETKTVLE